VEAVESPARPERVNAFRLAKPFWRMRQGHFDLLTSMAHSRGDIFETQLGPFRVIFLNNPEHIQELLVKKHKHYKKDRGFAILERILGNGLLNSEGAFHLRQRRLMQPAFHKERIASYAGAMVHYGRVLSDRWEDGRQVDMNSEMMAVTLWVIGKTMFNTDVQEDATKVAHALNTFFKYNEIYAVPSVGRFFESLPLKASRESRKAIETLNDVVYRIIREHRNSGTDAGDLLSMLLLAQDEDDGSRMTDKQVRDEALTLFLAGHETTAVALTWTWYLLSGHPEVEAKLHEEVDRVLQGRDATVEDVPQLAYTRRVFSEAMRLYPPAYGFGREALEDTSIGGQRIRKGDTIVVSPYITHRHPKYFPDPERFDPDRWLPERAEGLHKFAYFPFGGGVRKCIGEPFAWMEGVLLLATLAQRWAPRLVPGHPVLLDPKITLRPKHGVQMTLHRRGGPEAPAGT